MSKPGASLKVVGRLSIISVGLLSSWLSLQGAEDRGLPSGPLRTGFNLVAPTKQELQDQINAKPRVEKEYLALQQLVEIVPEQILNAAPLDLVNQCHFSLTDDDQARAKKYMKLALLIKDSNEFQFKTTEKYSAMALAFEMSFQHLRAVEAYVPDMAKADYYVSMAQINLWVVVNQYKASEIQKARMLSRLYDSFNYLKAADSSLDLLPTDKEFSEGVSFVKKLVRQTVDTLTEKEMSDYARDRPMLKVMLTDQESMDDIIFEYTSKRFARIEKKLKAKGFSDQVIRSTFIKYAALKKTEYSGIFKIKSVKDRKKEILKDSLSVILTRLIEMEKFDPDVMQDIDENHCMQILGVLDHFSHLAPGGGEATEDDFISKISRSYRKKIRSELETIMNYRDKVMDGLI